ncbi:50S ribosomal protein L16 [Candidatus Falkowbacteria bacterium CG_4_9_14_3_um_filter_38_19]|uniref:Large ribosomal subunit protein uL16 n=2 Tax=Candidatus Falkowiibacteriota TaxID=1752728 RepID=A0A2M6WPT1_9BACT|nr:50S ribosomal protein L16 [Candidatus Falkowbacteria bacterium]PIT94805.1 MAG: 50S ribosomal protein L16 [Candidatus Falkowbacteria bacterium CG10_big_fil_rev_8_21_14_0_10_38_22]PJB17427.1 MAG: 50S ribosomal protein L16 [Candidatus Falkowbacteria bacterium CG_4_9_14_3_um_filter_38_19]
MLMPKKTKYRKSHKLGRGGKASRKVNLSFGSFGLKSLEAHWITSKQIEAARRVITRYIKRGGKLWIRIFPDKSVTQKGDEIPMGKGKGAVDHYVAIVKPGMIMFEMDGVSQESAKEALEAAAHKLPIKCKFIVK